MGQGISVQNLISIIVPVYNTEKYLDQCIQSVLAQTYTNWELLLINDGSTDSSGAICDRYVAIDTRIKAIHKDNTGVSDSKNKALDIAQGDYIMFLDSDDYWSIEDCLEQLINTSQKHNADIVRGEYRAVDERCVLIFDGTLNEKKKQASYKVLNSFQFLEYAVQGEFFLVLSLFKRKILQNARFSQRIFLEDMDFYAQIMLRPQNRCVYIPLQFYDYRKHNDAVSNQVSILKLRDSFSMCYSFHRYSQDIIDIRLKTYYEYYSIMMYYWTIDTISQTNFDLKQTIDILSLIELRKKVNQWAQQSQKNFPIIIKASPFVAIHFFRYKHRIGRLVRIILKSINKHVR